MRERGSRRFHGPRARRRIGPGRWHVRARVERMVEPAVLLLLRQGPLHGYELLERLPPLVGEERVDMGNLYRYLRALEEDGIVTSEWRDVPGPAKRTYALTEPGRRLLDDWVTALRDVRRRIDGFLTSYDEEERR